MSTRLHTVPLFILSLYIKGLEEDDHVKIAGIIIIDLCYADHNTLIAENENKLSALIIKVKDHHEKMGLKLKIKKTKLMLGRTTNLELTR